MPSKPTRSFLLKVLGTLLSTGLLIALLFWSWDDVLTALSKISPLELLAAFGFIFASRLFTVLRWHTLLRSGGIPIPLKKTFSLTFTGLFATNFLPSTIGGDVVRLAGTIQLGYDRAICLASLAADRLVNMAGMSLASPLGFYQLLQAAPAVAQAAFFPNLWRKGLDFARRTIASLGIWLKKPLALLTSLGFAFAHMLCMFSANYLLIHALGGELAFWRVVGLYSFAYFIGNVPVSVNGYGWQELTVSALLTTLGGLDVSVAATVPLINRLLLMSASLPGALTLPGILAKMDRSKS
jgi:glycosyltransferase 2 family protein